MIHRGEEQLLLQEAPLTIPGTVHALVPGGYVSRSPSISISNSSHSAPSGGLIFNLALAPLQRYATTGDLPGLTSAIRDFRTLSAGLSPGSDQLADLQSGLRAALRQVYERTGDEAALVESLRAGESSVQTAHAPASYAERVVTFANALFAQYTQTGQINYLNRAGALLNQVLLVVQGTESYDIVSSCLAECLRVHSQAMNDDDALVRVLVLLSSTEGEMTGTTLVTYALCMQQRYYRFLDENDITLAIALCDQALLSINPAPPAMQSALLKTTAGLCALRAKRNGGAEELDHAVELARQAVSLVHESTTMSARAQIPLVVLSMHQYTIN